MNEALRRVFDFFVFKTIITEVSYNNLYNVTKTLHLFN